MLRFTGLLVRSSGPCAAAESAAPTVSNARGSSDDQGRLHRMQTDTFTAFQPLHNPAAVAHCCAALHEDPREPSVGVLASDGAHPFVGGKNPVELPPMQCSHGWRRQGLCRGTGGMQMLSQCLPAPAAMAPDSVSTDQSSHQKNMSRATTGRSTAQASLTTTASGWTPGVCPAERLCQRGATRGRTVMVTTPVTPELSFLIWVVPTLMARNLGV